MKSAATPVNIAQRLSEMARARPDAPAMVFLAGGRTMSFRELDEDCGRVARGLASFGVRRGMRAAVLVKPGPDFFALAFALFRLGAVPVLIDPGLGREGLGRCLEEAAPEVFIAIPTAHAARLLFGWAKDSVKLTLMAGPSVSPGMTTLEELRRRDAEPLAPVETAPEDPAAVLFTSGSTGAPKGVVYSHGNFSAQVDLLRARFGIEPGEVDLATFPLFALFDPALGMTAVIPEMDFTQPGSVLSANILGPIRRYGVTNLFGSPALLDRVSRGAAGVRLPSLKRVLSAGAPVSPKILKRFSSLLTGDAQIHTPYGATEALPVCSISSREVLGETAADAAKGRGTCVGRPLDGVELSVISITDAAVPEWSEALRAAAGAVGEFVVRGPQVTLSYHGRPDADAAAKIRFPDGSIGHRMGDLGRLDASGRAWFCGRKSQRVETVKGPLFTDCVEGIFNAHPRVRRSALVGVGVPGAQRPVLIVELEEGNKPSKALSDELLELGARYPDSKCLETVLFHASLPVDVRHNAKIRREVLAGWAASRLP
ncbi:MAG: AMP-binding protein [Elusimicrobia bacterium]|nr:AMP-binding protein [Elusimicrobiota bacterium]